MKTVADQFTETLAAAGVKRIVCHPPLLPIPTLYSRFFIGGLRPGIRARDRLGGGGDSLERTRL